MNVFRSVIERILSKADVRINGGRPWDIQVKNNRFYRAALCEGSLGLGESYMKGWWDCAEIEEMVYRLISAGLDRIGRLVPSAVGLKALSLLTNQQTRRLSSRAAEHYNLDNELFCAFLGKYKNYSCAYYKDSESLDTAQLQKLDLICRKLDLAPEDSVLDVGCGWGEIARFMAERRHCHVTGINISDEQIRHARERCKGLSVDVIKRDWRDIDGQYDKIAVIAMLTHVGYKNYRAFMETLHRRLKPNGFVLIETVGANVSLTHINPFLGKYFFPGAQFPSIAQMAAAAEGLFVIEDVHNFGPSYTQTLRDWNENLQQSWPDLSGRHSESVRRMFEFFFLATAAFFRARDFQNWQLVLSKQGSAMPRSRVA